MKIDPRIEALLNHLNDIEVDPEIMTSSQILARNAAPAIRELIERCEELETALKWYAEAKHYDLAVTYDEHGKAKDIPTVWRDKGGKAREVLRIKE